MALLVTDPRDQERLVAERRASGGDRFDEVWEGTYVMAPIADNEHQELAGSLISIFKSVVGWGTGAKILPGTNVSDRDQQWEHNYRCPDVAVFLPGTSARDCGSHWLGGPDFAVEILSPGDRTRQKLPFYASVKVRELLIIDRDPWALDLYRLRAGELSPLGRSTPAVGQTLESEVLPLAFRLLPPTAGQRPAIDVSHRVSDQRWTI
jgi:Uma2 family endonuclease